MRFEAIADAEEAPTKVKPADEANEISEDQVGEPGVGDASTDIAQPLDQAA